MDSATSTEFLSTREEGDAHSIVVKGGTDTPPRKDGADNAPHFIHPVRTELAITHTPSVRKEGRQAPA